MNAIKQCVQRLYKIDMRTFVPIAPGSNGYFHGLDANGNGVTVETNVTHLPETGDRRDIPHSSELRRKDEAVLPGIW
jgi:hypothetical protein